MLSHLIHEVDKALCKGWAIITGYWFEYIFNVLNISLGYRVHLNLQLSVFCVLITRFLDEWIIA